jgi:hypothetical protein
VKSLLIFLFPLCSIVNAQEARPSLEFTCDGAISLGIPDHPTLRTAIINLRRVGTSTPFVMRNSQAGFQLRIEGALPVLQMQVEGVGEGSSSFIVEPLESPGILNQKCIEASTGRRVTAPSGVDPFPLVEGGPGSGVFIYFRNSSNHGCLNCWARSEQQSTGENRQPLDQSMSSRVSSSKELGAGDSKSHGKARAPSAADRPSAGNAQ